MHLGAILLKNVENINNFVETYDLVWSKSAPGTLYLRLVDLNKPIGHGQYLRYIPPAGATMSVIVNHIDQSKVQTKSGSNPFPDDRSIWSINITANDILSPNSLKITLTVAGQIYPIKLISTLASAPIYDGEFYT